MTRPLYSFKGWNTLPESQRNTQAASGANQGTVYQPGDKFKMPAKDITLYAMWELNKWHDVIYSKNTTDATGPVPKTEKHEATTQVTVEDGIIREGYTFDGWNTQADGKGTTYQPGEKMPMPDRPVTLYAMWTQKGFDLIYKANTTDPTSTLPPPGRYEYEAEFTVAKGITRTGYTFLEWNTKEDGKDGESYKPETKAKMPNNPLTLFALWKINQYKVTATCPGGSVSGTGAFDYKTAVTLTASPNSGYRFTGWSSSDITIPEAEKTASTLKFTLPDKDVNVNANFEQLPNNNNNNNSPKTGDDVWPLWIYITLFAVAGIGLTVTLFWKKLVVLFRKKKSD